MESYDDGEQLDREANSTIFHQHKPRLMSVPVKMPHSSRNASTPYFPSHFLPSTCLIISSMAISKMSPRVPTSHVRPFILFLPDQETYFSFHQLRLQHQPHRHLHRHRLPTLPTCSDVFSVVNHGYLDLKL